MRYAAIYLSSLLLLAGCTVAPRETVARVPSFDGDTQNSGLLALTPSGGGVLTPAARARYNALIERFGTNFIPPLTLDAGITPTATNTYLLDAAGLVNFQTLSRWRRQHP